MTERLYHQNSFLYDFTAAVRGERLLADGRRALILDQTAFYPASGGQRFDTGWIEFVASEGRSPSELPKLQVVEVLEDEIDGSVLHVLEESSFIAAPGTELRGYIDVDRRQDHMQQHSGQHVLSAAFLKLLHAPTVSFHMGEESCTIDLEATGFAPAQLAQVERHANQMVWEDRQVLTHQVTREQAEKIGVRKLPPAIDELRIVEVRGVDLCACCGTHVNSTGQIGNIQLRKVEKVKHGVRVEFVCGERALRTARKDFEVLSEAAALYSSHLWEVPAQLQKLIDAGKALQKQQQKLLLEIAELTARQALETTPVEFGHRVVVEYFAERDMNFIKLMAQKLCAVPGVIALLGAGQEAPAMVFAQSPGGHFDAGARLKESVASVGGRGGGTRDLAQGGVPAPERVPELLARAAQAARAELAAQESR